MISVRPAGQPVGQLSVWHVKNFLNVATFFDTINVFGVKLCMMLLLLLLIERCLFVPFLLTLTYFKVTAVSKIVFMKFYILI